MRIPPCRCGEMADATDLKSVGLKRPVPVRVRPSAPLKRYIVRILGGYAGNKSRSPPNEVGPDIPV